MKLIITFYTMADSMEMDIICRKKHLPGRLIPIPRKISAGCGLVWCSEPEDEHVLIKEMDEMGIECEEVFRLLI